MITLGHSWLVIPQVVQEDDASKPGDLCKLICKKIHTAHLGETKSCRAAVLRYYWPGMQEQVRATVKSFEACQVNARQQPLEPPPVQDKIASRPMEKVSCDLFHYGNNTWLITIDWF